MTGGGQKCHSLVAGSNGVPFLFFFRQAPWERAIEFPGDFSLTFI